MKTILLYFFLLLAAASLTGQTVKNSSIAIQPTLDNTVPFEFAPQFRYDTTTFRLYAWDDGAWKVIADGTGGVTSLSADSVSITDAGGLYDATEVEAGLQEEATKRAALNTLSGVPVSSTDLGTFAGTTIADNATIKGALQDLETAVGRTVYFHSLDTLAAATLSPGDVAITKGLLTPGDGGGALYIVQENELTGFTTDEKGVVTVSGGYAVMQPQNGIINGASWFVNNPATDQKDQIQSLLNFANYWNAKIEWPGFDVRWFIDTNTAGATTFTLPSGAHIIGNGSTSKVTLADGSILYDSWFYTASDSITIEGMIFDGNKQNTTSDNEQTHLFDLSGGQNYQWTISNSTFKNFRRDAFKILSCEGIYFENCIFDENQRAHLVFQRGVRGAYVNFCRFTNGGDGHIDFEPTGSDSLRNIYITNNYFGSFLQGNYAIAVSSSSSVVPTRDVYVQNNTFQQGGIYAAGLTREMHIENNVFRNSRRSPGTSDPFRFLKSPDNFFFRNNTIYVTDSLAFGNAIFTISAQITEPGNVEITGNTVISQVDSIPIIFNISDAKNANVSRNRFLYTGSLYADRAINVRSNNDTINAKSWIVNDNIVVDDPGGLSSLFSTNSRNDTLDYVSFSRNASFGAGTRTHFYEHGRATFGHVKDLVYADNSTQGVTYSTARETIANDYYKISSNFNFGAGAPTIPGVKGDRYFDTTNSLQYTYSTVWEVTNYWQPGLSGTDISVLRDVGVNTTNPLTNFHVNGRGLFNSSVTVNNSSVISNSAIYTKTTSPLMSGLQVSGNRVDQSLSFPLFWINPDAGFGTTNNAYLISAEDGSDNKRFSVRTNGAIETSYGSSTFEASTLSKTISGYSVKIATDGTIVNELEVQSGTGTPVGAVTPGYVGQHYIDTTTPGSEIIWFAVGTGNTNWVQLN